MLIIIYIKLILLIIFLHLMMSYTIPYKKKRHKLKKMSFEVKLIINNIIILLIVFQKV